MPKEDTQFKPGNPGRPKGSRNKLSEAFIRVLADDFEAYGMEAIETIRREQPAAYGKIIASLLPKLQEIGGPDGEPIKMEGLIKLIKPDG